MAVVRRMASEGLAEFLGLPADWIGPGDECPPAGCPRPLTLRELREARFAAGVRCARCQSAQVQRWGSFSGRRRYRCTECHRTFSDLTGTPMAYSKLPWLWGEFGACLMESMTVRAAASRLGVSKDTAWRWRHRVLAAQARAAAPALRGIVEARAMRFLVNRKGERSEGRVGSPWPSGAACWVVIARDRFGTIRSAIAEGRPPHPQNYGELLGGRPAAGLTLVARDRVFGAAARFARQCGIEYRRAGPLVASASDVSPDHVRNVVAYQLRLRQWLRRFRGVATRYLMRYLVWHSFLDEQREPASRLILAGVRAPPMTQVVGRRRCA